MSVEQGEPSWQLLQITARSRGTGRGGMRRRPGAGLHVRTAPARPEHPRSSASRARALRLSPGKDRGPFVSALIKIRSERALLSAGVQHGGFPQQQGSRALLLL